MDKSIKRTAEEIDEQIRRGEIWTSKHPYSIFGDDNRTDFRRRKEILELAKKGCSSEYLQNIVDEYGEDVEYLSASYVLEWLTEKGTEDIYSKEGDEK